MISELSQPCFVSVTILVFRLLESFPIKNSNHSGNLWSLNHRWSTESYALKTSIHAMLKFLFSLCASWHTLRSISRLLLLILILLILLLLLLLLLLLQPGRGRHEVNKRRKEVFHFFATANVLQQIYLNRNTIEYNWFAFICFCFGGLSFTHKKRINGNLKFVDEWAKHKLSSFTSCLERAKQF